MVNIHGVIRGVIRMSEWIASIAKDPGSCGEASVGMTWFPVKGMTGGGGLQVGVLRTVWVRMLYFDFQSHLGFWV